MKKLLAAGYQKIFQIIKCFRDYESFGGIHNPEFTMIEWYRAPGTFWDFMDDMEKLFKFIGKRLNKRSVYPVRDPRGAKKATFHNNEISDGVQWRGKKIPINKKWERKTMKQVWKKFININLDEYLTVQRMQKLCREFGYETEGAYEDLFYKIFLNKIEPFLGVEKPIFVYDYPAQMCSLSKPSKNLGYAERVEVYIGGLEIANGFGELIDAEKQKNNLEEDRKKRNELGREIYDVDMDFINALESGIPSAGGIAMGMDRVVMLFTGAKDVNEAIFQSAADMSR